MVDDAQPAGSGMAIHRRSFHSVITARHYPLTEMRPAKLKKVESSAVSLLLRGGATRILRFETPRSGADPCWSTHRPSGSTHGDGWRAGSRRAARSRTLDPSEPMFTPVVVTAPAGATPMIEVSIGPTVVLVPPGIDADSVPAVFLTAKGSR
jgi:hypothetical protein